jgi:hypothetical protein
MLANAHRSVTHGIEPVTGLLTLRSRRCCFRRTKLCKAEAGGAIPLPIHGQFHEAKLLFGGQCERRRGNHCAEWRRDSGSPARIEYQQRARGPIRSKRLAILRRGHRCLREEESKVPPGEFAVGDDQIRVTKQIGMLCRQGCERHIEVLRASKPRGQMHARLQCDADRYGHDAGGDHDTSRGGGLNALTEDCARE